MAEARTEVTGTVWEVVATVGAELDVDDEIVILESMKMEVPIVAPIAGTLTELRVEAGQSVKAGDVIAVVEAS